LCGQNSDYGPEEYKKFSAETSAGFASDIRVTIFRSCRSWARGSVEVRKEERGKVKEECSHKNIRHTLYYDRPTVNKEAGRRGSRRCAVAKEKVIGVLSRTIRKVVANISGGRIHTIGESSGGGAISRSGNVGFESPGA